MLRRPILLVLVVLGSLALALTSSAPRRLPVVHAAEPIDATFGAYCQVWGSTAPSNADDCWYYDHATNERNFQAIRADMRTQLVLSKDELAGWQCVNPAPEDSALQTDLEHQTWFTTVIQPMEPAPADTSQFYRVLVKLFVPGTDAEASEVIYEEVEVADGRPTGPVYQIHRDVMTAVEQLMLTNQPCKVKVKGTMTMKIGGGSSQLRYAQAGTSITITGSFDQELTMDASGVFDSIMPLTSSVVETRPDCTTSWSFLNLQLHVSGGYRAPDDALVFEHFTVSSDGGTRSSHCVYSEQTQDTTADDRPDGSQHQVVTSTTPGSTTVSTQDIAPDGTIHGHSIQTSRSGVTTCDWDYSASGTMHSVCIHNDGSRTETNVVGPPPVARPAPGPWTNIGDLGQQTELAVALTDGAKLVLPRPTPMPAEFSWEGSLSLQYGDQGDGASAAPSLLP